MKYEKKFIFECAPLISAIYARGAITHSERDTILESIKNDPNHQNAISLIARKLINAPAAADFQALYQKLKGE